MRLEIPGETLYAVKAPQLMAVAVAMMVAEAGSNSQRNAERSGFRVAYSRLKWRLNK